MSEAISLKWVCDYENVKKLQSAVESESLIRVLDDLQKKLGTVDPSRPAKERYLLAREAGCPAAVAKGAKDRSMHPDVIYIPRTEIQHVAGRARISALKASLPVPQGMRIVAVVFRANDNGWTAELEVVEEEAAAA